MPPSRIHSAIQGNNVCTSPEEGWWATHMHELPRMKRQIPQESVFRFIPSFYPQVLVRHGQHATASCKISFQPREKFPRAAPGYRLACTDISALKILHHLFI